jgi:hypothetical protein
MSVFKRRAHVGFERRATTVGWAKCNEAHASKFRVDRAEFGPPYKSKTKA